MSPLPRHVALNALFLDPDRSGGPETYLRGLAPALAEALPQTRFTVMTTRRGAARLYEDGWTDFASLVALPADEGERARRLVAEQLLLPQAVARRGCDLVHSLASTAPLRVSGARTVITLHDLTFLRVKTFSRATTLAMRLSVVPPARHADALLTGSVAARDEVCAIAGFDPAALTVVPHGPGRPPGRAMRSGAQVRALRDVAPDARVVLCVGALRPHKNQGLLVGALAHLPEDVVVVLCGHPEPYAQAVLARAESLGVAHRLRAIDYAPDEELEGWWATAACVAFPTRGEGFGLPVLEGMGRGKAVACSDLPVLHEVGGDVPRYFGVDDPRGCAAAIEGAIADADDLGARGLERAAQFSWAAAAQATAAVYERAMAGS